MLVLDLFESQLAEISQVADKPPAEPVANPEISRNAAIIFTMMKNAYLRDQPVVTLEWPGSPAVTLTRNQIYSIFKKVYSEKSESRRNAIFTPIFGNRQEFVNFLSMLKVIPKPPTSIPTQPQQMPLDLRVDNSPERFYKTKVKEEKKSPDQPYRDVGVQRAMRRAAADFPTTASDTEAFAKSMLDQQEKDQQDINRLRNGLKRQRDILDKNAEVDNDQSRTIDSIRREILKVDQENDDLESMVNKMQSANARLRQTLDAMRGRKTSDDYRVSTQTAPAAQPAAAPVEPVTEPTVGVSVATDKPAALPAPAAAVATEPIAAQEPAVQEPIKTPAAALPAPQAQAQPAAPEEPIKPAALTKPKRKKTRIGKGKKKSAAIPKSADVFDFEKERQSRKAKATATPEPSEEPGLFSGDWMDMDKASGMNEMLTVQRFTENAGAPLKDIKDFRERRAKIYDMLARAGTSVEDKAALKQALINLQKMAREQGMMS